MPAFSSSPDEKYSSAAGALIKLVAPWGKYVGYGSGSGGRVQGDGSAEPKQAVIVHIVNGYSLF